MDQIKSPAMVEMQNMIDELKIQVAELQAKIEAKKDVGERKMTDADAERVMAGDLVDVKHKDAAAELGLSYGQIYSARMGFTFKAVAKALKDRGIKSQWL
jgi:hypothetical protein